MKKPILSTLLALTLCLSLLPAAALAANEDETLTAQEAESKYGISLSTDYIDFGTCYQWEKSEPVTVTLTNNGSHTVNYEYRAGRPLTPSDPNSPITFWRGKGTTLEPGESVDIEIRLNTSLAGSGTLSVSSRLLLDPQDAFYMGPGGMGAGKSGLALDITDILTIDYEVIPSSEISAENIVCDISVDSLDFGTIENPFSAQSRTFTVTNRGKVEFYYSCMTDCSHEDSDLFKNIFSVSTSSSNYSLQPGESMEVTVTTKDGYYPQRPRLVAEDCSLIFTAYYSDDSHSAPEPENTVTTVIPLSVTFLKDGGACTIQCRDSVGGVAVTEDGHRFAGNKPLTVAPGSDLTIRLTPWQEGYIPLALEVNGEFATCEDTYTFENIRDDIDFKVHFFNPEVPPAAWAREAVGKARVRGLYTHQIGDFSLPITREEFSVYAFTVYRELTGDSVEDYVVDSPYTDTTDPDVVRLSKLGVITGVGEGRFDPKGQLTREQAATILSRLAGVLEVELPKAAPTFADNGSISSWASDAVGEMQASGIMGGVGNDRFDPQGTYSCEQSIVTLMRLYDMAPSLSK